MEELKPGMVLSRDVSDRLGILIVSRGTSITDVLRFKLINYFRLQTINAPVFIESD